MHVDVDEIVILTKQLTMVSLVMKRGRGIAMLKAKMVTVAVTMVLKKRAPQKKKTAEKKMMMLRNK